MTAVFTPAARAEVIEAEGWYENESPGLGRRLRAEIDRVVQRMSDAPTQFPVVHKAVRRARTKEFPYSLFFLIEDDRLLVIACFHSSRDPQEWQSRA